jgi:large subunit ribosomal protein L11e
VKFSSTGDFGFGISEHIDLVTKYDTNTGIYGISFFVVLCRKGFRVARRELRVGRVGKAHKITKASSIAWFQKAYDGIVLNE